MHQACLSFSVKYALNTQPKHLWVLFTPGPNLICSSWGNDAQLKINGASAALMLTHVASQQREGVSVVRLPSWSPVITQHSQNGNAPPPLFFVVAQLAVKCCGLKAINSACSASNASYDDNVWNLIAQIQLCDELPSWNHIILSQPQLLALNQQENPAVKIKHWQFHWRSRDLLWQR